MKSHLQDNKKVENFKIDSEERIQKSGSEGASGKDRSRLHLGTTSEQIEVHFNIRLGLTVEISR